MNITEKDVGRKVWSFANGWGEIDCFTNSCHYAVEVNFNNGKFIDYTKTGVEFVD